ncbi:hypothetical protein NOX90_03550 [Wolbachia endosymbiont of Anurida maritima]|uniref:hypothetical protein n=1 Tax=Wolbachia endosymbiont of Anurida maritima TaxID=2850562 RepID=UPI0035CF2845
MIDFTENIFETVLQGIENNSSICSNDITTKIENELREYSSTRLDEINHSNNSINREMYFLNSDYNKEIQLLNSDYNKEIQLLNSDYNKGIQSLLLESNKNIIFAQKDYEKKNGLEHVFKLSRKELRSVL